MKKFLIFLMVVALVVLGWLQLRRYRVPLNFQAGKTAKLVRGDISLPITATGEVFPSRRIVIKAEASGEVLSIHKQAGELVRKGEVIITLDREEEDRNLKRATQDLKASASRLEIAQLRLKTSREKDLPMARLRVEQLEARAKLAEFRWNKVRDYKPDIANPEELLTEETNYLVAKNELEQARVALETQQLAIQTAEHDVENYKAAHEAAQQVVGDAQERLEKTHIVSPIDGMVGDIKVQVGEVIQGGKSNLTGGTVLATVIDVQKRVVRAEVDEADIGRIMAIAPDWAKPGNDGSSPPPEDWIETSNDYEILPVITVDSYRDETFHGLIERIYPEPHKVQEAIYYDVDVVIVSDNVDKLFMGMRADVEFTSERVTDVLICPNEAINEGPNGRLGVYTPAPDSGAGPEDPKPVFVVCKIGLSNGVYSEILEGPGEGDEVYTRLPGGTEKR